MFYFSVMMKPYDTDSSITVVSVVSTTFAIRSTVVFWLVSYMQSLVQNISVRILTYSVCIYVFMYAFMYCSVCFYHVLFALMYVMCV